VCLFAALWYAGWDSVRQDVLASDTYWLSVGDVQITPAAEWIHSDIRAEVVRDASFDEQLSIMDPKLTERIAHAFSLHPWIARVRRVRKYHPAAVRVDLTYRRPVCMVEVPGELLPVDVRGVLLPREDFSPVEVARYPRLVGVDSVPIGPEGTRWGDIRVVGAAEIAAAFGPAWNQLRLDRIFPSTLVDVGSRGEYHFELFTLGGTRILWGRSPGAELPGDPTAKEKVARLQRYYQEHGTLEGANGSRPLDIRNLASWQRSAGEAPRVLR